MHSNENRRHARIVLSHTVQLSFDDARVSQYWARDISLSGMYLVGGTEFYKSSPCLVTIANLPLAQKDPVTIKATLSRVDTMGFGIRFTKMDHRDFELLQTLLLYGCPDPLVMGEEFMRKCPYKIIEPSLQIGL